MINVSYPSPPSPPRPNPEDVHRRLQELLAGLKDQTSGIAGAIRAARERDQLEQNLQDTYRGPAPITAEDVAEAIDQLCGNEPPPLDHEEIAEWLRNIGR
jgi:hypothetical protein